MKKNSVLRAHISHLLKKGYSHDSIRLNLINYGFDEDYVAEELKSVKMKPIKYWAAGIIAILILAFVLRPSFTGFAVSDESYPAVSIASADYAYGFGLLYQGVGEDNKEHIYKDKSELPIQGKQKGSVNIVDYTNSGKLYYFTTGFYKDVDGNEIASSDLYDAYNNIINTGVTNLKYSASAWCDIDNNGFSDLIVIGSDNQGNKHFNVYMNDGGVLTESDSFDGLDNGDVNCFDNGSGWKNIVVCGRDKEDKPINRVYINSDGKLLEATSLEGIKDCDIEVGDFYGRGKADFIISGTSHTAMPVTYLYNTASLQKISLLLNQTILNPSISAADYNGDGAIDFAVSGGEFANPKTLFYKNINGEFFLDATDNALQLKDGKLLFFSDNGLKLFSTGKDRNKKLHAQLLSGFSASVNTPSIPTNLSYENINNKYIKLIWQANATLFNVRAGDSTNPNKYLSGFANSTPEINAFKILASPCNKDIDKFFFQVQSIDGAYAHSDWSSQFEITCKTNQTANETNSTNIILPTTGYLEIITKPSKAAIYLDGNPVGATPVTLQNLSPLTYQITITKDKYLPYAQSILVEAGKTITINAKLTPNITEPVIWNPPDQKFDNINYHAQYERADDYVLVTETITNEDTYTHNNIDITHEFTAGNRFYSKRDSSHIYAVIALLKSGEKKTLSLQIPKDTPYGQTISTEITSEKYIPPANIIKNITPVIETKDNKTAISVNVSFNQSILARDVYVKQTIPKCLAERINELSANSNREFIIINEDPVIMWHFDNLVDAEQLKLEIHAVAQENCTNQIFTEIVAKKYLVQRDREKPMNAAVLFVFAFMGALGLFYFVSNAKKYHLKTAIIIGTILVILLEATDTMDLLNPSINFAKKFLSWIAMIAFLAGISLYRVLFIGAKEKEKSKAVESQAKADFEFKKITHQIEVSELKDKQSIFAAWKKHDEWIVNFLLITAFIVLSLKDITYTAFTAYGTENLFGDLELFIILHSKFLETTVFFAGIATLLAAMAYIIMRAKPMLPSVFSFLQKDGRLTWWKKPLFTIVLVIGFYIAIFNFFFDWFSISFDAPMLTIIVLIMLWGTIKNYSNRILRFLRIPWQFKEAANEHFEDAQDRQDNALEAFVKMFTHSRNFFIAFSSLPVFIAVVELYNYGIYMLLGFRSIYFDGIDFDMLRLKDLHLPLGLLPAYYLQVAGLLACAVLAFLFWYHFYSKREMTMPNTLVRDKPNHPLLFSIFLSAFVSFWITPVLNIAFVHSASVAGMAIYLKEAASCTNMFITYFIPAVIFVLSYLYFKHKKVNNGKDRIPLNLLPYGTVLFTVIAITVYFMTGFFDKASFYHAITFSLSVEWATSSFVFFCQILYFVILLASIYTLIGEFLALAKEELGEYHWYHHLIFTFYAHHHKAHIVRLYRWVRKAFKEGISAATIIAMCRKQGYSDEDITEAMRHVQYRQ